jgi:hypothetical protein
MAEDYKGTPRRKLLVAQVAVLLVVFGLVIWGVGSRTSPAPRANLTPIATPAPSASFVLTRTCTQQELAFKGAITDCAVQLGGLAACSQTGNSLEGFRTRINLRGASKRLYELYLFVLGGYHGDGTYSISPPADASTPPPSTVAIEFRVLAPQQDWEATSGTLTIAGAGQSGGASAGMQTTRVPGDPATPKRFTLNGTWRCR